MNRPKLYDKVALTRDLDEYGLKRGDVATVIDVVPHRQGSNGFILEVFNAIGESIHVVIVTNEDFAALNENEIFFVRQIR